MNETREKLGTGKREGSKALILDNCLFLGVGYQPPWQGRDSQGCIKDSG